MIWVAIMAAIGIGGGFAVLTAAWVSDVRAMDRERTLCRRFGHCEFWTPGRLFPACPCAQCRLARLRGAVAAYNAELERHQEQMRAAVEAMRLAVAAIPRSTKRTR